MAAHLSHAMQADILDFLHVQAPQADRATLDALMDAYIRYVPWESASRIVRRQHSSRLEDAVAWPTEFWKGAMQSGIGGTCFESNYAMQALLSSLGYRSYLTLNDMAETRCCHTAIIVVLHGEQWLVDVGIPLHVPLRLTQHAVSRRSGPWLQYRALPQADQCFELYREPHPKPYIFTLRNCPVDDAIYRSAMIADYGPGGFFLDRAIITRIIGADIWRFSSADRPLHMEQFVDGKRIDHMLGHDAAARVAQHFRMDEDILRQALAYCP